MPLEQYRKKRDFRKTSEPKGKAASKKSGFSYFIQKHHASRLHYDLRLELDGVLLSWAVPKGPSLDPAQRRLAVHVEDHPVEYGTFEGTIPKGEYGGGTVMLWDKGTWSPLEDARKGMRAGKLKFTLHGKRLKGAWTLVKMKRSDETQDPWLLIKEKDQEAREEKLGPVIEEFTTSVATKRSMEEIAGDEAPSRSKDKSPKKASVVVARKLPVAGATKAPHPTEQRPQLASPADRPPEGPDWLHEIKFDGYRVFLHRGPKRIQLITARGQKDWTHRFANIAEAAQCLKRPAVLDGEIVVMQPDGISSFEKLQKALSTGKAGSLRYYVFDMPWLDGYSLASVPLSVRRELLQEYLREAGKALDGTILFSEAIRGEGAGMLAKCCDLGAEGIISKRIDGKYVASRGRQWLKVKCTKAQEFVIGGYTDPEGSRTHFGALLIGYYEGGELRYAGRVGTGFSEKVRAQLLPRLEKAASETSPFADAATGRKRGVHWVKPELVAVVEFAEWTSEGILRHPSFQALREDKAPTEIVREKTLRLREATMPKARAKTPRAAKSLKVEPRSRKRGDKDLPVFAGVTITSPDRVLYSETGTTKENVAAYYAKMVDYLLPHVAGRPLALVRCPSGQGKKCFFQKHLAKGMENTVKTVNVGSDEKPHIYIEDAAGLLTLIQFGSLEIHTWGCPVDDLEHPDRMIFDLDPDPGADWDAVLDGALLIREALQSVDLQSFVKTSGGKGLHVVVPIQPKLPWKEVKDFTQSVARTLAAVDPDRFVSVMTKAKRKGKVFIDYFRNGRGSTCVAAFSTRARETPSISFPIPWNQLTQKLGPDQFAIQTTPQTLSRRRKDPWADFFNLRQKLTPRMVKSFKR